MPTRTLGLEEGWIVRFYIGWRGERSILYKGVETSWAVTNGIRGTSVSDDVGS